MDGLQRTESFETFAKSFQISIINITPKILRVSMIDILPIVALNTHSANFLHWLHHSCQGFCHTSRPIRIKFEIISLPDRSSWLNSKIMASDLFINCEFKSFFHRSILYLQDYGHPNDKFLTYHFDDWSSYSLWWDIGQLLAVIGFLTTSFLI